MQRQSAWIYDIPGKYGYTTSARALEIQPEILMRLMFISIEGHLVTDFDTQSAFNRW